MSAGGTGGYREGARKTRVFLSYSRKDRDFTKRLSQALVARGYLADFDQSEYDPDNVETGISAEDDWWKRLQEMIAAAEAIVFVVSPDSAASRVCDEEIAYARALGKRIVPILLRPIDFSKAPPRLAALNVKLSFEDSGAFESSLATLSKTLDLDVNWHREGARLMALAVRWDGAGRTESLLLPGAAVTDADAWAARRPARAEPPGEVLGAYLSASIAKTKADRERLLTITGRAFVRPAERAMAEGRHDAALRLAAAGMVLSEDEAMRLTPQRAAAALTAAGRSRLRAMLLFPESLEGAAFSPDGRRIVAYTASSGWAWVRDAASGEEIVTLRGHDGRVTAAAFSPDGKRIITASLDHTARVWDAASGKEILALRGEHFIGPLNATCSNDGKFIATFASDHCRLWNAASGAMVASWSDCGKYPRPRGTRFAMPCLALSPDMRHVVVADQAGARLCEAVGGKVVAELHERVDQLGAAVFSADGSRIAVFTEYFVAVYDLAGQSIGSSGKDRIADVVFSPDGRRLVVLAQTREYGEVLSHGPDGRPAVASAEESMFAPYLWDVAQDTRIDLDAGEKNVSQAIFSPDGRRILTVARDTAWLWDATNGREIAALKGHDRHIANAAFSADGTRILTASFDGTVRIWDAASDNVIAELDGSAKGLAAIAPAAFSSDGARLCTTSSDRRTALLWDIASGRDIVLPGLPIAFSPDGRRLLVRTEKGACVCESSTGQAIATLQGDMPELGEVSFSADGGRVATEAGVWEVKSGRRLVSLAGSSCVAFSPDGRRVVTGGEPARVWDAATGAEVFAISGDDQRPIETVAFSPDGSRVTTSSSRSARLYDAANATQIAVLYHRKEDWGGHVVRAFFGLDGQTAIVLFQSGGGACVCDAGTGQEIASFTSVDHNGHVDHAPFDNATSAVSPAGTLLLAQRRDGTTHLIDIGSGTTLATWNDINPGGVAFSADGKHAAIVNRRRVRILDLSHVTAGSGDVAEALAASLANGCGKRTWAEGEDLLMQAAPDDLHDSLLMRLSNEQRANVAGRVERFALPLHPNCYFSPSQRPGWTPPTTQESDIQAPENKPAVESAVPITTSVPAGPAVRVQVDRTPAATVAAAREPPRTGAPHRGGGSALWIVMTILALGAATALALDRFGLISLG